MMTEMAPYMQTLPSTLTPPSSSLQADLAKKNETELEKIEAKIKDAETNMGETDLSEGLREKAGYYCRIGDKVRRGRRRCEVFRLTLAFLYGVLP
jgi:26S proteasome regulatory subunit N7